MARSEPLRAISISPARLIRIATNSAARWVCPTLLLRKQPPRIPVRDLLCHHSGLPRHDWIWLPGDLSPAQMLAAMRYLEPSEDIRTTFQYSNLGYVVASIVAERVSGQSWPEFTRARLTASKRGCSAESLTEIPGRSGREPAPAARPMASIALA